MAKTDKEKSTIKYYDAHARDWTSAHGGNENQSYWQAEMEKFHHLLPSGKIIEIGSGAGKDAAALIKMGFNYTGTDASSGLIEIASKRNPGTNFVNEAVDELSFPANTFDGFWASAVLLHIPKNQIDTAMQSIYCVTKPGGIGFITMKAGAGEREDPNTGRWFAFYSGEAFAGILKRNGFEILQQDTRPGEKDTWLVYFVTKSKETI